MAKIRELSPELLEIAMRELNEVPSRREADIAHIREWVHKQPHIMASPDDQMIIAFLRGCKFSLERTKEKIDTYYTMRTALPEFFKDRDVRKKELREFLELGTFFYLPGTDEKGRRILLGRSGKSDPNIHKVEDLCKVNTMLMDYMIQNDDAAVICGNVCVMDMSGTTFAHAAHLSPSITKKIMVVNQDACPFRLKGLHYVNNQPFLETVYNVMKSFAKEKLQKRIFLHGDKMECLYEHVPQELLPTEYGGKAGTADELNDIWVKRLEDFSEWFVAEEDQYVDESKRPGKPKTQQDLFGLEGSFRTLSVD